MPDRGGRTIWRWVALAAAAAGFFLSQQLTIIHITAGLEAGPLAQLFCGKIAGASCSDVVSSRWATVFGVPVSVLSSAYFLVAGVWYAFTGRADRSRHVWLLLAMLGIAGGSLCSLGYLVIMFTRLDTWCPLCVMCHAANFLLLASAVFCWRRALATPAGDDPIPTPTRVWVTSVLAVLLGLSYLRIQTGEQFQQLAIRYRIKASTELKTPEEVYQKWQATIPIRIVVDQDDPTRGPADAPHRLIVFSDLLCPACARLADLLKQVEASYGDTLRIVYKYLPLDVACNNRLSAKQTRHEGACQAARLAEAARIVAGNEGFWRFHDAMMANGELARAQQFEQIAVDAGFDYDKLVELAGTEQVSQRVARTIAQAPAVTTPVVLLDGRWLIQWSMYDQIEGNWELNQADTMKLWGMLISQPVPSTQPASAPVGPPAPEPVSTTD